MSPGRIKDDGYEPIDMDVYPYHNKQVLPNGIKVVQVIKGTAEDSFAGYAYRKKLKDEDTGEMVLSEDVVIKQLDDPNENVVRGFWYNDKYQFIGPVGDPTAQGVWYLMPDQTRHFLRPMEFVEFAENYKKTVSEVMAPSVMTEPEIKSGLESTTTVAEGKLSGIADIPLVEIDDLPADYVTLLNRDGHENVQTVLKAGHEELIKIHGIGDARAKEILEICEKAVS